MNKRVKKVNLMKNISKAVVVLVFFAAMLGKGTQLVAQDSISSWKKYFYKGVYDGNPQIIPAYYEWEKLNYRPNTIAQGHVMPGYLTPVDLSNQILNDAKYKQRLDGVINNAPFVFEGRMIGRSFGHLDDSYLFEIEKVYRGGERLQAGTVEIVVIMPIEVLMNRSLMGFSYDWHIIFAKEVVGYGEGAFDANNTIKLELCNDNSDNPSCFQPEKNIISSNNRDTYELSHYNGFYLNYRTAEEVRDFLANYYNLLPTDMPKADTVKNRTYYDIEIAKKRDVEAAESKLRYEESTKSFYKNLLENKFIPARLNQKEIDDAMQEFENASDSIRWDKIYKEMEEPDSLKKKSQSNPQRGGDTIATVTSIIRNDTIIKDANGRYLQFDIMVKSDIAGTYPFGLKIELAYGSDSLEQPFKKYFLN
jgi:hypothetical protein